jgi:hypothetical protein
LFTFVFDIGITATSETARPLVRLIATTSFNHLDRPNVVHHDLDASVGEHRQIFDRIGRLNLLKLASYRLRLAFTITNAADQDTQLAESPTKPSQLRTVQARVHRYQHRRA